MKLPYFISVIFAMPFEEMLVIVTFSLIIFVNLSTITMIVSIPFDLDNGPITLILISCHRPCDILSRCNYPDFF